MRAGRSSGSSGPGSDGAGVAGHLARNTAYQLLAQALPAGAILAAVPFLVRRLGPDLYGVFALVVTAVLMFGMFDLGMSRATTRYAARSFAARSHDDATAYFWGAVGVLLVIGVTAAVSLYAAVPWLVQGALRVQPALRRDAVEALRTIVAVVPAVTTAATFRGYLEASGRFLHTSLISSAGAVGNYAAPVAAVALGGGVVAAVAAVALVRVLTCAAYLCVALACRDRPGLRPRTAVRHLRDLASFGGWLLVSNVLGTAMAYGDRFLLGAWLGLAAVTAYTVPLDVVLKSQVPIVCLCTVLFPLLTRLDQQGSPGFDSAYRASSAAAFGLMAPAAAGLVILAPPLMGAWLGAQCSREMVLAAQVFLAGIPLQAMTTLAWAGLHARGRTDLTALAHTVEAPVFFAALFFAARRYGVPGAAFAWLGRIMLDFLLMSLFLRRANSGSWRWSGELLALAFPFAAVLLAELPAAAAFGAGLVLCTLGWAWAWRCLLRSGERSQLRALLARVSAQVLRPAAKAGRP